MKDQRDIHNIETMARLLNVSVSGYYGWLKREPSKRSVRSKLLLKEIEQIYWKNRGQVGSPKVRDALVEKGYQVNHKCVERIMRENGLYAIYRLKFTKATTNSRHRLPVSANLLKQKFQATKPNQIWVSDITYIRTRQGWLYLCVVLDLFSRKVVGWSMSNRMKTDLVIDAFRMAYKSRSPKPWELVFHSDRGSQYCSLRFRRILKNLKVISSMSRAGNCYDNACAESWFSLLKRELIYLLEHDDQQKIRTAVFDYIEIFYNRQRIHGAIKGMTPEEFELKAA